MKGTREGEEGSFRFPLSISKIGLSLPRRCLFVSSHQGLKRERMQAARVERQQQAEGERQREIEYGGGTFTWMGPPASPPLLGDYAGTQSGAGGRAGAPGEPSVRRLSSVESGAGVCARGLPHTVPPTPPPFRHPHNCLL